MYSRNTANGRGRGIIPPYNYGGTVYSRALREVQDGSRPQGMVRDEEARRAGSGAGTDVGSAQQNIGGVRTVRADSAHPVGTNGMNSVGRGIPDGAAVGVAAGRSAMQGMRRGVQPERQMGAQPAGGYAGTAQPNMRAAGAQPRDIRPVGTASARTVMHVGGRPEATPMCSGEAADRPEAKLLVRYGTAIRPHSSRCPTSALCSERCRRATIFC